MRFILCAFLLFLSFPAQADYFVWEDNGTRLSFAFPDTWRQVSTYAPDEIVRLAAPGDDLAQCVIRARSDKRFDVYPQRFSAAIQRAAYSGDFWTGYLASYNNVIIHSMDESTGLGRAFGSTVKASYLTAHPAKDLLKTSLASAGFYEGTGYIFECAALGESYASYQPFFQSILKSVTLDKAVHELIQGDNPDMSRGPSIVTRDRQNRYFSSY